MTGLHRAEHICLVDELFIIITLNCVSKIGYHLLNRCSADLIIEGVLTFAVNKVTGRDWW